MASGSRRKYLAHQKASGRGVAAVWPARFPPELLWAHGFIAAEVWDPPGPEALAPSHLQASACSIVRGGFELLASGGADLADLLVFPHTCDSIQNLATIAKDMLGERRPLLTLHVPKGDSGVRAQDFVTEQLHALSALLANSGWPATDESWREALALGRARSGLLAEMYGRRAAGELACTNAEFYDAVRACEYLRPEDALSLLQRTLAREGGRPEGTPLLFTGVLPVPKDLPQRLDGLGVRVVEDDFLGCGRRVLRSEAGETRDPCRELALRLQTLPPCSTQGAPTASRLAFLLHLVERSCARGVVFLSLRACEPDLFERPALVAGLKARGIPVLVLETETGASTPGGATTRLEAFLEVLA